MKHPDIKFVETIVKSILLKRRLASWALKEIKYVFFPSHYEVTFERQAEKKTVNIVTELIDEVAAKTSMLSHRRIKQLIKHALAPNEPDED